MSNKLAKRNLLLRRPRLARLRHGVRMDHGKFLPHDGHGPLRRVLALLRRPTTSHAAARRRVRQHCRSDRNLVARVQLDGRHLPHRMGLRALHLLHIHHQDQYRFCPDLPPCERRGVGLGRCLLQCRQRGVRDRWEVAEGKRVWSISQHDEKWG